MPLDRAGLRLMHVHAHPDDESSKGAASTARYVAEGVDVHVATCTGGERGDVAGALRAGGARPWQVQLVAPILDEAAHTSA